LSGLDIDMCEDCTGWLLGQVAGTLDMGVCKTWPASLESTAGRRLSNDSYDPSIRRFQHRNSLRLLNRYNPNRPSWRDVHLPCMFTSLVAR
jgi:hypothetical protein